MHDRALASLKAQLLPGRNATQGWWNACARGETGAVERAVAQARTRHARALQALERQCDRSALDGASSRLRLLCQIDSVHELLEMTQPVEKQSEEEKNIEVSGGGTALHVAAAHGHLEIVSYLLSLGAPLDRYDANGRHALHLACSQGWADVVKIILLHCPTRHFQIQLLKQTDCRSMDVYAMCRVARKEWLAAGLSAHVSGSFLRRKIGAHMIPGVRWWKTRKERRQHRRRRGGGVSGDNAGARDFERTRDLIADPPPPNPVNGRPPRLVGYRSRFFGKVSSPTLRSALSETPNRVQRRTRSPLASLTNEVIWRTALEYDEEEELQLGTAAAHAPALALQLEAVKTVEMARRILSVLRPALALGLRRKKRHWGDWRGGFASAKADESKVLAARRRRRLEQGGSELDWNSVDESAREQKELSQMAQEDEKCLQVRPYLVLGHLKLMRLQLLFHELCGHRGGRVGGSLPIDPKLMPPLRFARLAGLVGEFASRGHVRNILITIPDLVETAEAARRKQETGSESESNTGASKASGTRSTLTWDSLFTISRGAQRKHEHRRRRRQQREHNATSVGCNFINFVLFWLHAERLERHPVSGLRKHGGQQWQDDDTVGLDPEQLVEGLRAESSGSSMDNPAETIESVIWLQRIRARMRVDVAISKSSIGDTSNTRGRARKLQAVHMGVGIVPAWRSNSLASRRRERSSLVKFQPAAEFTKQEVIRQQRMRQSKTNATADLTAVGETGEAPPPTPPPPLLPSAAAREEAENEMLADKLNEDGTPKKRVSKPKPTKTAAEQLAAKRLEEAREIAKREAEREKLREQQQKELLKRQAAQAQARQEAYLAAQRQEKEQMERMKREKKKREKAAKKEKKKVARAERKESSARKRRFQKNRTVEKEQRVGGGSARRAVDRGFASGDLDANEDEEKKKRDKARAELNARKEAAKRRKEEEVRNRQEREKLADEEKKREKWLSLQRVMSTLSTADFGWAGFHRTKDQIALRKRELAKRRGINRERTCKDILGEDEYKALAEISKTVDPCRPPDDEDSVMDRKHNKTLGRYDLLELKLRQKNESLSMLIRSADGHGVEDADPRDTILWSMSDSFNLTGYAHRKGRFRLKPLELWA